MLHRSVESAAKSGKHGSDQSKMEDAVQKLKEEAADVGANGVVIQGTGESTSGSEVYKSASADMEKLESQMTAAQIADAQKSASEWFASHSQK